MLDAAARPLSSGVEQFQEDGFTIVRQLFSLTEASEMRQAFMDLAKDGPFAPLFDIRASFAPDDPLGRYPRVMNPHRYPDIPVGPLALRYLLDKRVEAILTSLMKEEVVGAQTMFYYKPAGARGQDLHQDNFYLRVSPGTCVAAWTAIDDADRDNGGMVVVPGSAQEGVACPEKADPALFFTTEHVSTPPGRREVPIDLKAGDCLFFNGGLIHGSYPNTSRDRYRRAFISHYVPRASAEVSRWYKPLLTFDGQVVEVADATGGGPCGTVTAGQEKGPH